MVVIIWIIWILDYLSYLSIDLTIIQSEANNQIYICYECTLMWTAELKNVSFMHILHMKQKFKHFIPSCDKMKNNSLNSCNM